VARLDEAPLEEGRARRRDAPVELGFAPSDVRDRGVPSSRITGRGGG